MHLHLNGFSSSVHDKTCYTYNVNMEGKLQYASNERAGIINNDVTFPKLFPIYITGTSC